MGFIFIIYYSILLFYLAFSRTTINFSLFPFFFSPVPPGVGQFCREEFSLVATLLRPPQYNHFGIYLILDIGYWTFFSQSRTYDLLYRLLYNDTDCTL